MWLDAGMWGHVEASTSSPTPETTSHGTGLAEPRAAWVVMTTGMDQQAPVGAFTRKELADDFARLSKQRTGEPHAVLPVPLDPVAKRRLVVTH